MRRIFHDSYEECSNLNASKPLFLCFIGFSEVFILFSQSIFLIQIYIGSLLKQCVLLCTWINIFLHEIHVFQLLFAPPFLAYFLSGMEILKGEGLEAIKKKLAEVSTGVAKSCCLFRQNCGLESCIENLGLVQNLLAH